MVLSMVCSWLGWSESSTAGTGRSRSTPFSSPSLSPLPVAGNRLATRLSCSSKNLWKLNWFLRDFGYDPELLERSEIDDKSLVGLCGVVKISYSVIDGMAVLDLDGSAPASRWRELSNGTGTEIPISPAIAESKACSKAAL
jgi:hypothetical protein